MRIAEDVVLEIGRVYRLPLDHVARVHEAGKRVVADGHRAASSGAEKERMALFFLARATRSLHAVEVLFSAGLEGDAVAALRTLVELTIDFDWIWSQDTDARLRLYVEFVHVINERKLAASERIFGPVDAAREEAAFQAIAPYAPAGVTSGAQMRLWRQAEYQRVAPNYPNRASWCPRNIRERATDVQLDHLYDLVHRWGSEQSHSGPGTLVDLYELEDQSIQVLCEPTVPSTVAVLGLLTPIYLHLAERARQRMGLAPSEELQTLDNEAKTAAATFSSTR
jgi:hypothetical protein